ncbi:MAG: WD40 repeat domain-containing protein [Methanosarcinaceae archaeon]|nr:WD40 repeat domain-containing protein [Methanosarcinaceae archaeon]
MGSFTERLREMPPGRRAYALNMPIHFIRARALSRLEKVLTDCEFIEAKAHYGLISELIQDYSLVNSLWPDEESSRRQKRRLETILEYVKQLIAYSHDPEQNAFPVVPSSEILISPKRHAPIDSYGNVEHIRFWGDFVSKHTEALRERAAPLFQMAYNSADAGPVVSDIEQRLKKSPTTDMPWISVVNRPRFSPDTGLVRVLEGVERFTHRVIMDSSGRVAASAGYSGSIWIWDLESGQPIRVLKGHTQEVSALASAFDMGRIVSGSKDGTIRIWDPFEGSCLLVLDSCDGRVCSLAVTPIGRLAVSCGENAVRVWDLAKNECVACLEDHIIAAVAISADGKRMALAGGTKEDHSISVYEVQTLTRLACLTGHDAGLFSIAMTPDGKRAVSGSYDQRVGVWDLERFECLGLHQMHSAWVGAVDITPDGHFAVSGSGDGSLRLWDLERDRTIALKGHMKPIDSVAVSADGLYCLSAGNEGGVRLWNLAIRDPSATKEREQTLLKGTPNLNRRVLLSEEGTISVSRDGSEHTLTGREGEIGTAETLMATSDISFGISRHTDNVFCIWNLTNGELIKVLKYTNEMRVMNIVPGTAYVCMISKEWTVEVLNLQNGNCLQRRKIDHRSFESPHLLTPDSRHLVLSDKNNSICFFDLETNKMTEAFEGHTEYVSKVEVSPDGERMYSISGDNTFRVWNIDEKNCICKVEVLDGQVNLEMSPDSRHIAISDGFNIRILDSSNGDTLHSLLGHNHFVGSVVFSPDGQHVITCDSNSTMRIWNVESGHCIASHVSDSGVMWPEIIAWPYIITNTKSGKPSLLRLENAPTMGRPIVSARRLWRFGEGDVPGAWDKNLKAVCFYCGRSFEVELKMIGSDLDCPIEDCSEKLHINSLFWDRQSM